MEQERLRYFRAVSKRVDWEEAVLHTVRGIKRFTHNTKRHNHNHGHLGQNGSRSEWGPNLSTSMNKILKLPLSKVNGKQMDVFLSSLSLPGLPVSRWDILWVRSYSAAVAKSQGLLTLRPWLKFRLCLLVAALLSSHAWVKSNTVCGVVLFQSNCLIYASHHVSLQR